MLLRDNIFGSIEEDAQRRDFTINSLYYSVADFTVRDYVGGMKDLQDGVIRLIGNPETRYREDPVRMLRAVRFAAKLNMTISPETAEPLPRPPPCSTMCRRRVCSKKCSSCCRPGMATRPTCCCGNTACSSRCSRPSPATLPSAATARWSGSSAVLKNTDTRIHNDMRVNPAFLFAVMFWYPLLETAQKSLRRAARRTTTPSPGNERCAGRSLPYAGDPKRITTLIRDIWQLQLRMSRRQGKRARKLMEHPKFRAAYDLLELRAGAENNHELQRLTKWWGEFSRRAAGAKDMLNDLGDDPAPRRRHRRPRKRAPRRGSA